MNKPTQPDSKKTTGGLVLTRPAKSVIYLQTRDGIIAITNSDRTRLIISAPRSVVIERAEIRRPAA